MEILEDILKIIVQQNPAFTHAKVSEKFNLNCFTIHRHLKNLGKVCNSKRWLPLKLFEENLQ